MKKPRPSRYGEEPPAKDDTLGTLDWDDVRPPDPAPSTAPPDPAPQPTPEPQPGYKLVVSAPAPQFEEPPPLPPRPLPAPPPEEGERRARGSGEKIGINLRFTPDQWTALGMLSAKQRRPKQDLLIEALELLLQRYGEPTPPRRR